MTDKINKVEKHFSALAMNVASVARKTARLRDKGDVLAKGINEYADAETTAMGQKLKAVGECFAALEDFRQAEVRGVTHSVRVVLHFLPIPRLID